MDDVEAVRHIDDALAQEGFQRDHARPLGRIYTGHFVIAGDTVGIEVEIEDLDFVRLPNIYVTDVELFRRRKLPHILGQRGYLCYLDPNYTVLDRYNPGGTVLRCLNRARVVLNDALQGKLDADFAAEFQAYWRGNTGYVDLPKHFNGDDAVVYWVALDDEKPENWRAVIARRGMLPAAFKARHRQIARTLQEPMSEPCAVIQLQRALTVDTTGTWPPSTLKEVTDWLTTFYPNAERTIKASISRGQGVRWWVLLSAPNGFFLFRFDLPPQYQTPELTRSRRVALADTMYRFPAKIPIIRVTGTPIDADYVFNRALYGRKSLMGRKILLIGCGSIGGYLAQLLAESGAGAGDGGALCLIDHDSLETANIGRHLLGVPYLDKNKAVACREFLTAQIPHVRVDAIAENVLANRSRLLSFDLVIDATGEEALSTTINDFAVRKRPHCPPVMFVYLLGNGAAAQALFTDGKEHACLKCLKPELAKPPRFPVVAEEPEVVHNVACGDTTYIPFPVSRAVQAAALALDVTLDWANGNPRPNFRTRVLDDKRVSHHRKDSSPAPLPQCPACGAP